LFPSATDDIQNGAPDGLALIHDVLCVAIDALSYEGSVTAAVTPSCGTLNLVEGSVTTVADDSPFTDSLQRTPNGADTDNAAVDWGKALPTPGAANP
jgi:large repetitive protein